jgi:hypothetical protein
MMTYPYNFTDKQNEIIQKLPSLGLGGLHATHGLAQNFRCIYCDMDYLASFDAFHSIEIDHIIPQYCGGAHSDENTAICCRTCNFLKHMYKPNGNNREGWIADARRDIKEKRKVREENEVATIRLFIRGDC